MSWKERIEQTIQITTADGKVYRPLYRLSPRRVDFNVSQFEFPNIDGTLVSRQNIKGYKYDESIVFQDENHREKYLEFEKSVKDKRPIQVLHPMYGLFNAHIISMVDDPTGLSNTKVEISMVETILAEYPKSETDPNNQVGIDVDNTNDVIAESFDGNADLNTSDVINIQEKTDSAYELGASSVKSGDQSNTYITLYNAASDSTVDLISFLSYPSQFIETVSSRLSLFRRQFNSLKLQVTTPMDKLIYELFGNAYISGMINSSVNPQPNDYGNVNDVIDVINTITSTYNTFISNLDAMQTPNGSELDSYVPNYGAMSALNSMVNYALSNLFNIALTANQQRKAILEADSNLILLAHRFYGASDANFERFVSENSIGLNEIQIIEKGREVVYYV